MTIAAFVLASSACAAGTAAHRRKARAAKKVSLFVLPSDGELAERKDDIAKEILDSKTISPEFAARVVDDPRFDFEPRIVVRYERLAERITFTTPHVVRHGYGYVTNVWSKQHGIAYLASYEPVFASASSQFTRIPRGVPAGIIGAETQYGYNLGENDYPILQTLLTLAVYDPGKKMHPEQQLLAFLWICEQNHWDPYARFGSRTGAFGIPQFEPLSYEKLAMYWDGSHCRPWKMSLVPIDLMKDADAICSTFNYLSADGFGGSWTHREHVLYLYNHDWNYCAAILRVAAYFDKHPTLTSVRAALN